MSDNIQSTSFSKGVNSPKVIGLEEVSFNNGFSSKSLDFPLSYSGAGVGEISYSLGSGSNIQGMYNLKVTISGISASVLISCNAKVSATPANSDPEISILGLNSDDVTLLKFKRAELFLSGGIIHLVATFGVDSTSTVASSSVSCYGQSVPLGLTPYGSIASPTALACRVNFLNDSMMVNNFRNSSLVNVDMNFQKQPGTFSCNPASAGSRPAGHSGFGSCLVFGGNTSTYLAQLFMGNDGFCYVRNSSNSGSTWSTWSSLGDSSSLINKVDKTIRIPGTSSLNAYTTSGFFDFLTAPTDSPAGLVGQGTMVVSASADSAAQYIFDTSVLSWYRSGVFSGGIWSWNAWVKVAKDSDKVNKVGDSMTGALNFAPRTTVASAATTAIGAATSNSLTVSGTTTITSFGVIADGVSRVVTFSGALTLTHNSTSLILPSAANIVTVAGDVGVFESLGAGNWKCVSYTRADGKAVTSPVLPTPTSLHRGAYARESAGAALVVNTRYGVYTGTGAVSMTMPTLANCASGDEILLGNLDSTWGINSFTITCPANVLFLNRAGSTDTTLVCNTNLVQGIRLYCYYNDGTNARWAIM